MTSTMWALMFGVAAVVLVGIVIGIRVRRRKSSD